MEIEDRGQKASEELEELTKASEELEELTIGQRLANLWRFFDMVGEAVMGSLWRVVYETGQDAIALCFLFSIPSWIGKIILKEDYSGFDQCYENWNTWNVNRYACYVIVGSGFLLWIMVAGRIIGRTANTIIELFQKKEN